MGMQCIRIKILVITAGLAILGTRRFPGGFVGFAMTAAVEVAFKFTINWHV